MPPTIIKKALINHHSATNDTLTPVAVPRKGTDRLRLPTHARETRANERWVFYFCNLSFKNHHPHPYATREERDEATLSWFPRPEVSRMHAKSAQEDMSLIFNLYKIIPKTIQTHRVDIIQQCLPCLASRERRLVSINCTLLETITENYIHVLHRNYSLLQQNIRV